MIAISLHPTLSEVPLPIPCSFALVNFSAPGFRRYGTILRLPKRNRNSLAVLLSQPSGASRIEKALHDYEVQPATELMPDLPEMGDALKPQTLQPAVERVE